MIGHEDAPSVVSVTASSCGRHDNAGPRPGVTLVRVQGCTSSRTRCRQGTPRAPCRLLSHREQEVASPMASTTNPPSHRMIWPPDPKPAHLRFLRWLAERGLLEHQTL